jgi:protein-S-isoprenylcysteine O-methyltransferase Ste14
MTNVGAIDSSDITKIGIGVIVALVVLGFLLSLVITALVGRLVVLVIVVALGLFVWQQRTSIENNVKKCHLDMTFVGVHINAPADVTAKCKAISK